MYMIPSRFCSKWLNFVWIYFTNRTQSQIKPNIEVSQKSQFENYLKICLKMDSNGSESCFTTISKKEKDIPNVIQNEM